MAPDDGGSTQRVGSEVGAGASACRSTDDATSSLGDQMNDQLGCATRVRGAIRMIKVRVNAEGPEYPHQGGGKRRKSSV